MAAIKNEIKWMLNMGVLRVFLLSWDHHKLNDLDDKIKVLNLNSHKK